MRAVLPINRVDVNQAQVGLVHKRGRLQRVAVSLPRQMPLSESSQFLLDARYELLKCGFVAMTPCHQEMRQGERRR